MSRNISPLLLGCLIIPLTAFFSTPAHSQSRTLAKVVIKVSLSDNLGQNFGLVIKKLDNESAISAIRVKTSADGSVSVSLVPGDYVVESEKPLIVKGKSYEWSVKLKVESSTALLELNNENATITAADEALRRGRIVDETDLLKVLSDGVVNVQGELAQGTGSIVDSTGLILTSQHVIERSKELRVQFGDNKKVAAKLVAEDPDLDLAILWVDLSACPSCKALASGSNTVVDGSGVFTISSLLAQDKTLTKGTLRTTGDGINTDFKIASVDSGAPVFNRLGEVIGVLRFVDQNGARQGTSGVIRIQDSQGLLAKARQIVKEALAFPSPELLPTEPADSYPAEDLKNLDLKKFKPRAYEADFGEYQLTMITPVLKHYLIEQNRIAFERQRKKIEKDSVITSPVMANSFYQLRNWSDYINQMRPVVHLLIVPEVSATGKSTFFSLLTLGVGLMSGGAMVLPPDFKFKADFEEMSLTCDGKPITPIQRGKIEFIKSLTSYLKMKQRTAYAGIYTYSADAFAPDKCKQMSLKVVSQQNPTAPQIRVVDPRMVQQVWSDFEPYRQQAGKHFDVR
ncbi:MAG TPA: serine protease, partial [Pyrinomonadaceae bacterium]|nr:serine protease [Pyrinomonadaceae bacterium]